MNRVVVTQAAAGLAAYLRDQVELRAAHGTRVLIGHDARHGSERFALDTAEVLAAAGFDALVTDGSVPTPVVAFGIRNLGCVAAVVVTASHNPARDNGYKVYLGDGSQIVPPADAEIAARIAEVAAHDLAEVPRSDGYSRVGPGLLDAYAARAASLAGEAGPRDLRWAYTPMHGVGGAIVLDIVARAGFPAPAVVEEQAEPDPDFPTVAFPNPEEPGAIDLALALGERIDADVVVANDPDADRCAVAARFEGTGWRMLTGDELGVLLGEATLRRGTAGTYACSVVSSTQLGTVAAAYGQPFTTTLTGFKWIGRVPGLAFGYEEAIGYCVDPEAVRDKDGMTALVRVLALVAELKAAGMTVAERLDEIAATYGVVLTAQQSVRVDDLDEITRGHGPAARAPAHDARGRAGRGDRPVGRAGRPAADRRRAAGGRDRAGRRPPVGHRAQAQGLPRGQGSPRRRRTASPTTAAGPGETLARLREEVGTALGLA